MTYAEKQLASVETTEGWIRYESRMWYDAVREKGLRIANLSDEERVMVESFDSESGLILRGVISGRC